LGGQWLSDPAIASLQVMDQTNVFAVGPDHALWTRERGGAYAWSDHWESLGGDFASLYAPSAISWGPKRMDVFAVGHIVSEKQNGIFY